MATTKTSEDKNCRSRGREPAITLTASARLHGRENLCLPSQEVRGLIDPRSDEIDPSWWEHALAAPSIDGPYELPELLSTHLQRASNDAKLGAFQKSVLQVLAMATSAMLDPEDWLEPFTPMMQIDGRRTIVPSDLDADQVALLARIAPQVTRDDLRARVADVAWVYGDRSKVEILDLAIDAYRAAPLTDVWYSAGKNAWVRAFALANRRGPCGRLAVQEMSYKLKAQIIAGTVTDQFRTVAFAEVLRHNGRVDPSDRAAICAALFRLAGEALARNPRLSRHLEREAISWLKGSDQAAANDAAERIARTYLAEADARVKADPAAGAQVEGHFLEQAIAVFRTLPRSYRIQGGLEQLIDELRARQHDSRESAMEQMMRIESDPVDLTDAVSDARSRVSGHFDRFDALAAFATLAPPLDADKTRESAMKLIEGSLSHIFASSTFSADGRKVAATPGSTGEPDESTIWAEIVRTASFHAQLMGQGVIQPAQEVLTTEHRYSREYIVALCRESPTVPEGHEVLWGSGLALGLAGDCGPRSPCWCHSWSTS